MTNLKLYELLEAMPVRSRSGNALALYYEMSEEEEIEMAVYEKEVLQAQGIRTDH